ncbi:MAG: hypothetical protein H6875_10215 [Hyphomicrobiaceae bacterium]|nr:hypothetical protein [Hyphomicrobiaceae bacterium]
MDFSKVEAESREDQGTMLEFLASVAQRQNVIALAIVGALLVTAGALAARPDAKEPPRPLSRQLTLTGYVLTGVSMLLFIIAGYMSDQ